MSKFNFILGVVVLIFNALGVFAITCGPHVGQSFALLTFSVSLIGGAKLFIDQLR